MELRGNRIKITPMKLEDVYNFKNWGIHENPLLADYNLPQLSHRELEEWYYYKTNRANQKYFSVFNEENKLIGYFGIKRIRKILKDAVLGIVFDPNYVNQGYGTETIRTFLDYYFNVLKMRKLYLEVSKFNRRALRCYEKNGFKIVGEYLDEFFDQNIDVNNPYFVEEQSSFVIKKGKIYNYIYKMEIDRKAYLKERDIIEKTKAKNQVGSAVK
ncbi:MAG: GNAT family N-acetyltransferase [Tissierellales bacterium]|jgi:diamine N-acetyltransferase